MTITEITLIPFALKLKTPFQYFSAIIENREGYILRCVDELGNIGFGECSPLPGFSKESFSEAEAESKLVIKKLSGVSFIDDFKELENKLENISPLPSVQFGIEQSLFNLLAKRNPATIRNYFPELKSSIKINAVVGLDDIESVLTQVKKKVLDGYKTIKLKIGRDDPFDDFYLIVTLRNVAGYDFKLRLDANKKWTADEAIEYLNRLQEFDIEYIEEPCELVPSTFRTVEESMIPVALDESIESLEYVDDLIKNANVPFIVLKPLILGSFFKTMLLIKEAENSNKNIIISSSFESAIGKSALVFLSALTKHPYAHGLDTAGYFEKNICEDVFPVQEGSINFDLSIYPPNFNL